MGACAPNGKREVILAIHYSLFAIRAIPCAASRCDSSAMTKRLLIAVAATTMLAGGCAPAAPVTGSPAAASPRGHLMIVGGGPIPAEVTKRFVDLASARGKARIAVLPMASAVPSTGPDKVAELRSLGAEAFVLVIDSTNADADSVQRLLSESTAIWFPGGDQSRITKAMSGTRSEKTLRESWIRGTVIGGTSAGAAVMSATMITGDERRPGGDRPPSDSSQAYITIDRNNIVTSAGFGLLDNAIVDQHFVRRKRQNRLVSLVLEKPELVGVGIDESTALLVRPDGTWEILGASVAVVFDARRGRVTSRSSTLGASDVRMHVLPAGSVFDPSSGAVRLLSGQSVETGWKSP
jgi:cyanophycinase